MVFLMVLSAVSWCCMVWICLGIAWNCWDSQSRSSTVQSTVITGTREAPVCGGFISLLVRFAQGMDGLLKVAGMMTSLVMKWIIPKNPLRLAPVSYCGGFFSNAQYVDHRTFNMFDRRSIIQSDVFFFNKLVFSCWIPMNDGNTTGFDGWILSVWSFKRTFQTTPLGLLLVARALSCGGPKVVALCGQCLPSSLPGILIFTPWANHGLNCGPRFFVRSKARSLQRNCKAPCLFCPKTSATSHSLV